MGSTDDELVNNFVLGLNLGPEATGFLKSLPEDVRGKVIKSFNPRGTKDGNVFGRLQAFARSMMQPGNERHGQGYYAAAPATNVEAAVVNEPAPQTYAMVEATQDYDSYAWSIGLDENGVRIFGMLPQDLKDTLMSDFNPRGTKDGNVLARLLGFARIIWAQRMGLDQVQKQEAAGLLRGLSEEAQARVMAQFDYSGTKDGNILARLQRFAADVASRFGGGKGGAPAQGYSPAPAYAPAPAYTPSPAYTSPPVYSSTPASRASQPVAPAYAGGQQSASLLSEFVSRMGLDAAQATFLQGLQEEVRSVVLNSFNPAGTKDGNVWGRLFGFVRSVWAQRLGLDAGMVAFMKSLPEESQRVVMVKFDPSRTKDGNIAARLESFARSVASNPHPLPASRPAFHQPVQPVVPAAPAYGGQQQSYGGQSQSYGGHSQSYGGHSPSYGGQPRLADGGAASHSSATREFVQRWGLNTQAAAFIKALPETVSSVIVGSFNANGTKDGNVWGRLFGFVRSVWSQKLGLDSAAFSYVRSLPEDVQMEVMVRFQPGQVPAHELLPQLQAAAEEAQRAPQGGLQQAQQAALAGGDDLEAFAVRCGLDAEAVEFLRGLQEEVRAAVVSDFDPSGTKDGNVFGRLQNFARAVENRQRRMHGEVQGLGRNVRPRWGEA